MSGSASAAPALAGTDGGTDLEELAQSMKAAREELLRKIESGRVRDAEKERVRVKQFKAVAYIAREERKLEKLRELKEQRDELERIKEEHDLSE